MENLYDTIRSLEKEKAHQEATLQEIREDMRQMRDRIEQQNSGVRREYESSAQIADQSHRQLESFKKDFTEMFSKMQSQINKWALYFISQSNTIYEIRYDHTENEI